MVEVRMMFVVVVVVEVTVVGLGTLRQEHASEIMAGDRELDGR